jgi:hypothetical protein
LVREWRNIPQPVRKKYTTFSTDRIVALLSVNKIFSESYDFAAKTKSSRNTALNIPNIVDVMVLKNLVKGTGSILFPRNGLKTFSRKNYKNHLRSNNYEVCTAVALCIPNILNVMVLENIKLSSDRNRATVIVV